jgi:hypothetical protein
MLSQSKPADSIKKLFLSHFDHGPALLEHFLLSNNLSGSTKLKDVKMNHEELAKIMLEVGRHSDKQTFRILILSILATSTISFFWNFNDSPM